MTRTYPYYSVWFDVTGSAWEVVRWDGPKVTVPVQMNIYTREKAEQALADWRARQADKEQS